MKKLTPDDCIWGNPSEYVNDLTPAVDAKIKMTPVQKILIFRMDLSNW